MNDRSLLKKFFSTQYFIHHNNGGTYTIKSRKIKEILWKPSHDWVLRWLLWIKYITTTQEDIFEVISELVKPSKNAIIMQPNIESITQEKAKRLREDFQQFKQLVQQVDDWSPRNFLWWLSTLIWDDYTKQLLKIYYPLSQQDIYNLYIQYCNQENLKPKKSFTSLIKHKNERSIHNFLYTILSNEYTQLLENPEQYQRAVWDHNTL